MPRKLRQLRAELRRSGFALDTKRGKGSHTYWTHPMVPYPVVLSGHDGDDADHYQERDVRKALEDLRGSAEKAETMSRDDLHYTLVISWSKEDHKYVVSFPEWGDSTHTHGATYEEAARNGEEVLADLVELVARAGTAAAAVEDVRREAMNTPTFPQLCHW